MLYAGRISKEVDHAVLGKMIHPLKWLDFEKLSAYYVDAGIIQACLDEEFESIHNEVIDGASDEINTEYEKMADLRYDSGMEGK